MEYRMKIISDESIEVLVPRKDGKLNVKLEVGKTYMYDPIKPTTKRDKERKGRIVMILGFTDNFMADGAIVRYLDNNRRGRVNPCYLVPYEA